MTAVCWLDLLQATKDADTYALVNEVFKRKVTPELWRDQVRERRERLGRLVSRTLQRVVWHTDPPNAPLPGTYAIVQFRSVFERVTQHIQFVMLHSFHGEPFLVMQVDETSFHGAETRMDSISRV